MSQPALFGSIFTPSFTAPVVPSSPTTEKVKYFLAPSDWFIIGSALSVSSAVAVVMLRIVGRISFIRPFSTCVITSVVLGLLGIIYKGCEFNVALYIEPIKAFTFKNYLGEGSSFKLEGQNYYIALTEGDGACGAHAMLGTKIEGYPKYMYREGNVREHYVNTLLVKMQDPYFKPRWEEWMIHFVQDYLSPCRGFYSALVFNEPLVKTLKEDLALLELKKTSLQTAQKELFTRALQEHETIMNRLRVEVQKEEQRTGKEGLLYQLEIDDAYRFCKMQECLDAIVELLQGHDVGRLISENLEAQKQNDAQRTECYRAFVKKDEVLVAYTQGVSNSSYYFATQELGLMAYLFNLHVKVFHETNGIVTLELDEGNPNRGLVEVFHSGIHFSRCERQNSL